jgi:hypothetical protein
MFVLLKKNNNFAAGKRKTFLQERNFSAFPEKKIVWEICLANSCFSEITTRM